ncbi:MAG: hypothetical protein M0Q51_07005 [Bacteroidales bacterium]|nr:hypothetical protein [Bacteroidales bacterium]
MKSLIGCLNSANIEGYPAAIFVGSFLLFKRNSRTFSILLRINGNCCKSFGSAPTSHKHHRVLFFKNSSALMKGLIYFLLFGSALIKSSFSFSDNKKLPLSTGLLPQTIIGKLHIGVDLDFITRSLP